jgi:hypothetical protein
MSHLNPVSAEVNNGYPSKKRLTGREFAAWTGHASVLTKLCIAAAVLAGEVEVTNLTITQIARMLGVNSKQIKAIAELTPEQRAGLADKRRLNVAQRLSNEMLDDIVNKVGANRLWAAIDRATAPTRVAAE